MKKVKIPVKRCGIICLNAFLLVFDLFLFLLILAFVSCFVCSLINIIILLCSNEYAKDCCGQTQLESWLEVFGISLTGVLIPVATAIFSTLADERHLKKQISELLADGNNIRLYFIKFPLGAWHNLLSAYYEKAKKHTPPLSNYEYAMHLVFRGNIFQAFRITVLQLGYIVDSKEYSIWTRTRTQTRTRTRTLDNSTEYIISDSTGVEHLGSNAIDGTNITILLNDHEQCFQDHFTNLIDHDLVVNFDLRFDLREDRFILHWKQFAQCAFFFPIIRSLYAWIVFRITRYSSYRYSVHVNKCVFTDDRKAQLCYNIYNIKVENKRTPTKVKRAKQVEFFWENPDI